MLTSDKLKVGKLYEFSTITHHNSEICVLSLDGKTIIGSIFEKDFFVFLELIELGLSKEFMTLLVLTNNGIKGLVSVWPEEIHEIKSLTYS